MSFVDSHCHLDDGEFDTDRDAVIERARAAGLKWMLSIGTGDGPPDLACAVRLAERFPFIYATVGVHPNDAAKLGANTFQELTGLLQHPKVVAVGEIGLDYHWDVPKDVQMPVFLQQLEIAKDAKKPVVIHTRDAWNDTIEMLREHWAASNLPCVLHCFTGTLEQAKTALDLGFYLAFGGVITFPKNVELREVAKTVPIERMLIETDAPYLAPVPYRGKRNEPAYVVQTAGAIAELRNISPDTLGDATSNNFGRIFGITSYTGDSSH